MVFHVFENNYIIYEYIHNYFYTIVPLITTSMAQGFLDSCTNVPISSNIENVIAIYYNSIVYIYMGMAQKNYIYISMYHIILLRCVWNWDIPSDDNSKFQWGKC